MTEKTPCPCGSARHYDACCGPYHRHAATPETAEALMRSRYCAFVLNDADYLLETWHDTTRPASLALEPTARWLGLRILATTAGGRADHSGTVEFVARYKLGGRAVRQHEVSRFSRQAGRWYYVDGLLPGKGR